MRNVLQGGRILARRAIDPRKRRVGGSEPVVGGDEYVEHAAPMSKRPRPGAAAQSAWNAERCPDRGPRRLADLLNEGQRIARVEAEQSPIADARERRREVTDVREASDTLDQERTRIQRAEEAARRGVHASAADVLRLRRASARVRHEGLLEDKPLVALFRLKCRGRTRSIGNVDGENLAAGVKDSRASTPINRERVWHHGSGQARHRGSRGRAPQRADDREWVLRRPKLARAKLSSCDAVSMRYTRSLHGAHALVS